MIDVLIYIGLMFIYLGVSILAETSSLVTCLSIIGFSALWIYETHKE